MHYRIYYRIRRIKDNPDIVVIRYSCTYLRGKHVTTHASIKIAVCADLTLFPRPDRILQEWQACIRTHIHARGCSRCTAAYGDARIYYVPRRRDSRISVLRRESFEPETPRASWSSKRARKESRGTLCAARLIRPQLPQIDLNADSSVLYRDPAPRESRRGN